MCSKLIPDVQGQFLIEFSEQKDDERYINILQNIYPKMYSVLWFSGSYKKLRHKFLGRFDQYR